MSMSSTKKTYLNSEYLHPSSTHSYDSNQSPLALLAQTCSSIGKDCSSSSSSSSSISNSTPPIITSLVRKSSSLNITNSDKSFSSIKNSSPFNSHTNKNSTHSLKTKTTISTSSSFIEPNLLLNYFPPLFDLTTLFLRSSFPYLSSQQQHSYSRICTIPGCLQCQTFQYFLSNSINNQFYICHYKTCNAKFSSNDQLLEHIRYNHRTTKMSNYHRFHPYLKPSNRINPNDELPYFYPHLSLSSMTETTTHLNKNPDSNN